MEMNKMSGFAKHLKKIIAGLDIDSEPKPEHRAELRRQMLSALEIEGTSEPKETQKRGINMNRIAKIAATILVVVGIGAGIVLLTQGNGTASIAWADVGAAVERARTICFTMTVDKGGAIHYSGKTMYAAPGLTRLETTDSVTIFDRAKGRFLTLDTKNKTARPASATSP